MRRFFKISLIPIAIIIFVLVGVAIGYFSFQKTEQPIQQAAQQKTEEEKYLAFLSEIYDKIKENYWEEIKDKDLANLFKAGTEKLTGSVQNLGSEDKDGVQKMVKGVFGLLTPDKRKPFTVQLANLVLVNLKPNQRSALYSLKQKEDLKNTVNNVNPERNLYDDLGVSKEASSEEMNKAYEEKKQALEKDNSSEAQEKLKELEYSYGVLSDEQKKARYEQAGIEPTIFQNLFSKEVFYVKIDKISPNTFQEFQDTVNSVQDPEGNINTLIIDLRGNIGGAIDFLPYFLGPFIGQNQYAYEFFSRGQNIPFKTQTGWLESLYRYKKVVILIDNQTQSSAEVFAATLKKYNVGVLIGTATRGWGTVERAFPVENQIDEQENYSVFLVHSLTLRDDGQPIEGRGVEPNININDADWEKQLLAYYNSSNLIQAIKQL